MQIANKYKIRYMVVSKKVHKKIFMILKSLSISFILLFLMVGNGFTDPMSKLPERPYTEKQCYSEVPYNLTFDYVWKLVISYDWQAEPIPVTITIESENKAAKVLEAQTPYEMVVPDDFKRIVVKKGNNDTKWRIAFQNIKISYCEDREDFVDYKLYSFQPVVEFNHRERRYIDILPSPDHADIYVSKSGKSPRRMSSKRYYYPYEYCPDFLDNLTFPNNEKGNTGFASFAKTFFCYLTQGNKQQQQQALDRVRFPVDYIVRGIEGDHKSQLTRAALEKRGICCGSGRPSVVVDGVKGNFNYDRHGSGEGIKLWFEFDTKKNIWYLIKIGIDSY